MKPLTQLLCLMLCTVLAIQVQLSATEDCSGTSEGQGTCDTSDCLGGSEGSQQSTMDLNDPAPTCNVDIKNVTIGTKTSTATTTATVYAKVGTQLSATAAPVDGQTFPSGFPTWAGIGSGGSGTSYSFTVTAGTSTLTATSGNSVSIKVVGVSLSLISVQFTSDHGVLKNHTTDYKDGGYTYSKPEWAAASTSACSPITQTKNTNLSVNVSLKIEPSGLAFKLYATGSDNLPPFPSFNDVAGSSTGSDQEIALTSYNKLPNYITHIAGQLSWKVKIGVDETEFDLGSSGVHNVYVTVAEPTGSDVTLWRIKKVVNLCDGETGIEACLSKLQTVCHFDLDVNFCESNELIWKAATGANCDCISQVRFYMLALKMLGFSSTGDIKFVIPQSGFAAKAVDSPFLNSYREARPSDGALMGYYDQLGGPNKFEATYLLNGKYYMGGTSSFKTSAFAVMQAVCERSFWQVADPSNPSLFQVAEDWPVNPVLGSPFF